MDDIITLAAILCLVALVAVFINKRLLTLVLSSAFMLLVAMRLSIPTMYTMGTVLLALPAASWAVGWYGSRSLVAKLTAPESVFEGERFPVRVEVRCRFAAFAMLAHPHCQLPRWLSSVEGSGTVNPTANGLVQEFIATPQRRGVFDLSLSSVQVSDPLGIFTISRRVPHSTSVIVYPTGLPTDDISALGSQQAGWIVDAVTGRRGDDEGFYGTREYRMGDDVRRIHWRSSARYGSLVVMERESWSRVTVWICLDVRRRVTAREEDNPPLERAVKTVVTIMEAALKRGEAVGLLAPGEVPLHIAPVASDEQRWRILDALARVTADGDTPLEDAVLRQATEPGATAVLVTAAPTYQMVDALSWMRHTGMRTALVVIEDNGAPEESKRFDGLMDTASALGTHTLVVGAE